MAHIVRLDKRNTHAWQVRGRKTQKGYYSKLFSDGRYGDREASLKAAQAHVAEYDAAHGPGVAYPYGFHQGQRLNSNKSGVTGVYRTHDYGKRDRRRRDYWAAFYTIDAEGQQHTRRHIRFYTEEWGDDEAKRRAIEFRQMWEEAAKQGIEAVRRFFDEYQMGWLEG
jgi:hypothetical protein